MDNNIKEAIQLFKGAPIEIGKIFGHETDPAAYELKELDGDKALGYDGKKLKYFPASEIFDVNKVNAAAIQIKTFGNYREDRIVVNL